MALTLNLISFFSILSLLSSAIFISEFFLVIINNTISVFSTLKLIALRIPYLITISLTFYRMAIISFILPPIINLRSFIKDRLII